MTFVNVIEIVDACLWGSYSMTDENVWLETWNEMESTDRVAIQQPGVSKFDEL